jgi:hypothetical protein
MGILDEGEGKTYEVGRTLGEGITNDTPGSCVTCTVTCEDQWSLAQSQALVSLSSNNRLLGNVLPRAKRTAGHYAALFLGDEGTPGQGRFYWPGLAAFAAKQVVDGIDYADKSMEAFGAQVRAMAGISLYYLMKGNFWVFVEVAPWVIYYRDYGHEIFFHCIDRRDVNTYNTPTTAAMRRLPWALGENTPLKTAIERRLRAINLADLSWGRLNLSDSRGALAEINNCKVTAPLKDGFQKLRAFETEARIDKKPLLAYQSAWSFLQHEQTLHLQTMIYDHADFRFAWDNNDMGRWVNQYWNITGARDPDLVFNAAPAITPQIEREQLQPMGLRPSDISERMTLDDGKLYDSDARMRYVERILQRYHKLMTQYRDYMIRQLRSIEAWKDAT